MTLKSVKNASSHKGHHQCVHRHILCMVFSRNINDLDILKYYFWYKENYMQMSTADSSEDVVQHVIVKIHMKSLLKCLKDCPLSEK